MKLEELGERRAIDMIWDAIGKKVDYDDCAVIDDGKHYLLLTTDYVGEETHFPGNVNPRALGRFIAAVNLSDIAAMGGTPEFFMLSSFMPGDTHFDFAKELITGMRSMLERYDVEYLGGDFKKAKMIGFSGFAVGRVLKENILRRRGAKVGDGIFVTAPMGKNAASYYLWKAGLGDFEPVLKVEPRVREGKELAGKAHTCMDTSDGLIASMFQMQKINNLGFSIDLDSVPLHPLAIEVMEDLKISLKDILNFGGDYELVYTASSKILGYEIGEVVEGKIDYGGKGYESFGKVLDQT